MPDTRPNEPNQIDISLSLLGADSKQALDGLVAELKAVTEMMRQIKAQTSDQAARLGTNTAQALTQTTTGTSEGASRSITTVPTDTTTTSEGLPIHKPRTAASDIEQGIPKLTNSTSQQAYDANLPATPSSGVSAGASESQDQGAGPDQSARSFTDPLGLVLPQKMANWGPIGGLRKSGPYGELGRRLGPEAVGYAAYQHFRESIQPPIPLTPHGMEAVGAQYGQGQGPISGSGDVGIPGLGNIPGSGSVLDKVLNNIPFTIPGTQFLTPAGRTGIGENVDTLWDALKTRNINANELTTLKGSFRGSGYSPGEVNKITDRFVGQFGNKGGGLKNLGDLGTTAELADQMLRNLPKSDQNLKEMSATLAQIPGAAHGARMGVEEFKSELNKVANDLQGQGALTFKQGAQTTTAFSGALHTPPETLSALMNNPIFKGQMIGRGYMPWQIGSAPPDVLAKNMFRTFDLLGGSAMPFKKQVRAVDPRHPDLGATRLTPQDQRNQFIANQTGLSVENIRHLYAQRKWAVPRAELSTALGNLEHPDQAERLPTTAGLRRGITAAHFGPAHTKELFKELEKLKPGHTSRKDAANIAADIQKKISKWEGDKPGEGENKITVELSRDARRFFGLKDENKRSRNKAQSSRVEALVRGPSPTSLPASGGEPIPSGNASFSSGP